MVAFNFYACKTQPTGYLNLHDDAKYVGKDACQKCHQEIYNDYLQTGMGKSWYRPTKNNMIEQWGSVVLDHYSGYAYRAYWEKDSLWIQEFICVGTDTTHNLKQRIDYIVGSGHQTRSYILERNGYLYEAPITWYVEKRQWDLSPGYENGNNSRFNRPIGTTCLHCHNAYSEPVQGTINRYKQVGLGIDCERCHGPGSIHIAKMEAGEEVDVGKVIDCSIVNPSKLPLQRQIEVCQQCHLQGVTVKHKARNFRPAERLADNMDIFTTRTTDDENSFGIASHADRMLQSQCFIKSSGKLNCTTCHDPHKSVKQTNQLVYLKNCAKCHQQNVCTETEINRNKVNDNCIKCHMPKSGTSDIPHVQFTDHYIRVVKVSSNTEPLNIKNVTLVCGTQVKPANDVLGQAYLLFYEESDAKRDYLAKASTLLADTNTTAWARLYYLQAKYTEALIAIEKSLTKQPNEINLLYRKAEILQALDRKQEAAALYLKVFDQNNSITEAAEQYAICILDVEAGNSAALDKSSAVLERAFVIKPFSDAILANLGFIRLNQRNLTQAKKYLMQALSYNPKNVPALESMFYYYILTNNKKQAAECLNKIKTIESGKGSVAILEKNLQN